MLPWVFLCHADTEAPWDNDVWFCILSVPQNTVNLVMDNVYPDWWSTKGIITQIMWPLEGNSQVIPSVENLSTVASRWRISKLITFTLLNFYIILGLKGLMLNHCPILVEEQMFMRLVLTPEWCQREISKQFPGQTWLLNLGTVDTRWRCVPSLRSNKPNTKSLQDKEALWQKRARR